MNLYKGVSPTPLYNIYNVSRCACLRQHCYLYVYTTLQCLPCDHRGNKL